MWLDRTNSVNNLPSGTGRITSTLPLLCEISGALHLAQPGLTAGRLAVGRNIRLVVSFNQGTASLQPYQCIPAGFFRVKQGGVTLTYTVGRSATAVKVLTREILSLTLDLLLKSVLDL